MSLKVLPWLIHSELLNICSCILRTKALLLLACLWINKVCGQRNSTAGRKHCRWK
jgi:hypothetical protein